MVVRLSAGGAGACSLSRDLVIPIRCYETGLGRSGPHACSRVGLQFDTCHWILDGERSDRPTRHPVGHAVEADAIDPAVVESLRRLGSRSGRDVLGELTALFLSTAESQVATASELLDRSDLPELARIAHALKGSASVIGARRVSAAGVGPRAHLRVPERPVAGGSVAECRAALTRLVEELEAFRGAVDALGIASRRTGS